MYSNNKNVEQLVSLLKAHQVHHAVLSSGSRNSPIIHSLARDPSFTCHTVVDERSAGFYALGIAQCTGETVAVCCTSGTAALNYAPAVAEAYYQQLPLIVITADRPAAWIGQMAGQTLPQPGIFNSLVKKSVHLPQIASAEDEWHCNRLLNEAILAASRRPPRPVHINIPLSEPLSEPAAAPEVRKISYSRPPVSSFGNYGERFLKYRKRMIIAGQSREPALSQALNDLVAMHDCVALAEHLSQIPSALLIHNFDALLYALTATEWPQYAPDLLITVEGHIVSKRIRQFLRDNPPAQHWHISPGGEVVDTYQCLTDVVEADGVDFITYLAAQKPENLGDKSFSAQWLAPSLCMPEPDVAFSDLKAVGALLKALPPDVNLHLANSSSVRLAQLFRPAGCPRIFSNRGTSGIDGCLSTAVGGSCVSRKLTFLLIGDLAFFYDMNVLWNRPLKPNLRILLNNNQGGEIFHSLPSSGNSAVIDKYIAVRHTTTAKAWAEDQGFTYLSVSNDSELQTLMPAFTATHSTRPILMEVFSSKERNVEILRNYYTSLKTGTGK
ncbi:MAG: 2-succinyl-5-enolpyruvyl-6-hydroxy-3-cyclohexene-1-carboxylic-acid synthase [Tannerellaceae bacterium]|jgi:2-succinyl-5-enolpyruvyl-6-hydroxy-3-cyclohexene-1-carboxylate synthase|nr:2-succinyl-5-enolpyruvyl-6-hydroxy-3-cyclohexene-1-carboxylic-acid synthase [Tannerellaceae bacterium]